MFARTLIPNGARAASYDSMALGKMDAGMRSKTWSIDGILKMAVGEVGGWFRDRGGLARSSELTRGSI